MSDTRPPLPLEEHDDSSPGRIPTWLTETPYWAISAVIHVIAILVLGTLVMLQKEEQRLQENVSVRLAPPRVPPYDPTKRRHVKTRPEVSQTPTEHELIKLKHEEITPTIPKGVDLTRLTDLNLDNSVDDAFGSSGGAASSFGLTNRLARGVNDGSSPATEEAVLAALHWLRRHQHGDGRWSSRDFVHRCVEGQPCTTVDPAYSGDRGYSGGTGFEGYDVGVTALAMLAFLGYGHTHETGEILEFRHVVRKAMRWLLGQQASTPDPETDGVIGKSPADEWIYNHAIATMALGELLIMSQDRFGGLPKSVTAATRYILRAQNEGYAWKYGYKGGVNDTSVTGWMILALKTSKMLSDVKMIPIEESEYSSALGGALSWFDRVTSTRSGRAGYMAPGDPGSRLQGAYPEPYPFSKDLSCMTGVSVLCRLFAGQRRSDPAIRQGVDILMANKPTWRVFQSAKRRSKINLYYWYYASYAMFQYGGKKWLEWNDHMQAALLPTQRQLGCEDGSWDPIGEWGVAGGRVYSTAIGAMTLEVYYRFQRTQVSPTH